MADFKKFALDGLYALHQRSFRPLDKDLFILLDDVLTNLGYLLNGGLTLEDNLGFATVEYTSNGSADTEDTVAHTLGRVPTGFIVVNRDKGGIVYDGGTAWTATNIYLKCTTTSTVLKILVF